MSAPQVNRTGATQAPVATPSVKAASPTPQSAMAGPSEVGPGGARIANAQLGQGWKDVSEATALEASPADLEALRQHPSLRTSPQELATQMRDDLYTAPGLSDAQKAEMAEAYLGNLREGGPIGLKQPFQEFSEDVRQVYASRGMGLENEELVVHGSAASGQSSKGGLFRFTGGDRAGALEASDLDVAARVSPQRFQELAQASFSQAQAEGRIPASIKSVDEFLSYEGKLSKGVANFRNNLQNGIIRGYNIPGEGPRATEQAYDLAQNAGRKVQLSVVEKGTAFDAESRIPLRPSGAAAAGEEGAAVAETAGAASKLGTALRVGGGVVGVAGGGLQVLHGADELAHGQVVDGGADVTAGTANVVAGGAMLAGATTLAAGAGGVGAVIDGGRDLIQGIRSGDTERTAVGGVKTAAGAMMIAGAATGNPVLAVGGALVYGGAVVYQNREAIGQAISSGAEAVGNFVSDAGQAVGDLAGSAAHAVGDGWKAARNWVGSLF